jgi:hypothetical protein
MSRCIPTLFLIISLDGKISTGDVGELDVDQDFKRIVGMGGISILQTRGVDLILSL